MSKRCMGCMSEIPDELEMCPYCGFAEGTMPDEAIHMEPGSILRDRFVIGRVLGFGAYGVTYIGWDALLEQKVAIKEYLPTEFATRIPGQTEVKVFEDSNKKEQFAQGLNKFVDEALRLAKFNNCDGIVKFHDSFEENSTAYIIMEYLDGETLTTILKRDGTIEQDKAVQLLIPVMQSLSKVHEAGIIHRDISPDNIIITENGEAKLIDFGAARYATATHSRSLTVIIKPGYSPEEQYRSRGDQGPWTDVYAVGATLYRMITGETPPDALQRRAMLETKKKDIIVPPSKYKKDISTVYESAIMNALNVRIEDRTQDMEKFIEELTSDTPAERLENKIKKIDFLKWPLWAKIGAPAGAALAILLCVLLACGVIGPNTEAKLAEGGMYSVPELLGQTEEKAEQILSDKAKEGKYAPGVNVVKDQAFSDTYDEDTVCGQNPQPNDLVKSEDASVMNLTLSKGPEQCEVPPLIGMTQDAASAKLNELGFAEEDKKEKSAFEEGCVFAQSPDAGELCSVGSKVMITVSDGNDFETAEVTIPDFTGKTLSEVNQIATDAKVKVDIVEEYSGTVEKGLVIKQSVTAGTSMSNETAVTVTVSLGEETVSMIDLTGLDYEEAKTKYGDLFSKLKITKEEKEDNTYKADSIISQSAKKGEKLKLGTEVTLVVAIPANVDVPNVVGEAKADAIAKLNSAGLKTVASDGFDNSGKYPVGTVMSQDPTSGSVKYQSQVTIVVSSGKEIVTVPQLIGMSKSDAESALSALELKAVVTEDYSLTVPKGTVISQGITAGLNKEKGSSITFVVSKGPNSVNVPDVRNMTASDAKTKLEEKNLKCTISYSYDSNIKSGYAVSYSPDGSQYEGTGITVVISMGKQPVTVNLNANGGSGSRNITVYLTSTYGQLPTPAKDYCSFDGWYTSSSGGSRVYSSTQVTNSSTHTLYAHWSDNPTSGWVLRSNMPSNARVVDDKWTYDLTSYKTSSSSSLDGWTQYNKNTVEGQTQGPVYSDPSNGSRKVWSEQYVSKYIRHYRYYHRRYGNIWGSDSTAPAGERHEIDLTYPLPNKYTYKDGLGITFYGDYQCTKDKNLTNGQQQYTDQMWIPDGDYDQPIYGTRWYYKDITYTYDYKKVESKESRSKISGDNISNVMEYVRYQSR